MSAAVAFFRNLNLGQSRSHSPTRPQLLAAFERAGARNATNFQVNGTVIFETDTDPQALAEEAVAQLTPVCGYDDAAVARHADWLRALELDPGDVPANAEVSFFDGPDPFPEPLPWVAPRGGLTVTRGDALHAVSVNDVERTGGATYVLEKLLAVPVTSRGVPTVRRLQVRLASLAQHGVG